MKNTLHQELYDTILDILKQAVPGGWSQLKLYGEADEEQCFAFFYIWKAGESKPIHSSNLPKHGVDEELLADLLDELDDCLISLWEDLDESGGKLGITLTLTLDAEKVTNTEILAEDLQKTTLESRQKAWEKKYL